VLAAKYTDGIHTQEVYATLHSIHIDVKVLLRSQRDARMIFFWLKTSRQTNGNESTSVKYLSRK
jgi:hypothetical protein